LVVETVYLSTDSHPSDYSNWVWRRATSSIEASHSITTNRQPTQCCRKDKRKKAPSSELYSTSLKFTAGTDRHSWSVNSRSETAVLCGPIVESATFTLAKD